MKKASLFRVLILAAGAVALFTASCSDDDTNSQPTPTITDLVVNDPNFSILETAVTKAGLANALATTNPLTVFAPNNAAFAASGITEAVINSLPVSAVDSILKYHVVPAFVTSTSVPVSDPVNSLLGTKIWASRNVNGVFVNGIKVSGADVQARNGVVHVIDKVLIPPTRTIAQIAAADTNFSFLVAAAAKVGLVDILSNPGKYTVFAPTNAGFRAAGITDINAVPVATLNTVVRYHIINNNIFASDLVNNATVASITGGGNLLITLPPAAVKISGSAQPASGITRADIVATNGVIHVINRVMLP